MSEVEAGVGFILQLMIDRDAQGQGYGRSTVIEVMRRLRLSPEVELIATSHRRENVAAARLYASLGLERWSIPWAQDVTDEVYLVHRGLSGHA